jgi:glycosyltransferase involved in cell wall biosynthesis
MKEATLSLCMIAKNEEKQIARCLGSAKNFVDEIIVVDTGSNDRTVEIAKQFGAKVVSHEWKDDFSDARNVSLEHASGDWILVIDSDETISKEDLEKIRQLIKDENGDAYKLTQRNYREKPSNEPLFCFKSCQAFQE